MTRQLAWLDGSKSSSIKTRRRVRHLVLAADAHTVTTVCGRSWMTSRARVTDSQDPADCQQCRRHEGEK